MRYSDIKNLDIANGPGCRTSLFVSGCRNRCVGCFNPETWDFDYGWEFDDEAMDKLTSSLSNMQTKGLTVLGGEPLEPENQGQVLEIVSEVKETFPQKDIWMFTGFTFEELFGTAGGECRARTDMLLPILQHVDVLVDGRFDCSKKNMKLRFRGSSNQRLLDVAKSIANGHAVLWKDDDVFASHERE